MTKRPTRYGLPYKGSKNKIADWVCDQLPVADNFYDLFCGGCSVTHAQLLRGRFKRYVVNDICGELPRLFDDASHGRLNVDFRFVSREEFFQRKDTDIVVRLCWSFGMAGRTYIYGKDNQDFKRDYHMAVVDGNVEPMKRWGYDLSPILRYGDIESRSASFQDIDILPSSVVYCDIPYAETDDYENGGAESSTTATSTSGHSAASFPCSSASIRCPTTSPPSP